MKKVKILNLEFHNWKFEDFILQLKQGVVLTPNVDHLMTLQKDQEFYECYSQAEHVVCDSRIIQFFSKLIHPQGGIVEQIAGSDLFPAYYNYNKSKTDEIKIFLLGGSKNSVQIAKDKINQKTNSNIIIGAYSPPFGFEKNQEECQKIVDMINSSKATTLAIGVGAPKQEKWICRHKDKMPNIKLFFAIGATIEFEAGALKRAPRWMTKLGLEWLFRMTQEPGRLMKRYLINDIPFIWMIIKQKLGWYKNPWR